MSHRNGGGYRSNSQEKLILRIITVICELPEKVPPKQN